MAEAGASRFRLARAARNGLRVHLLLVAGEFSTLYGQSYLTMMVAQYSLSDLRMALFNHVERLPMSFFDRTPTGRLVSRMTTDIDAITEMFSAGSLTLLIDVLTMLGIVAIMFAFNARLALWAMCAVPPLLIILNFFGSRSRVIYREIRERLAALNAYLAESLAGMAVVQLFTREKRSREEFEALNLKSRDAQMVANIYEAGVFSAVESLSSATIGIILWAGGGQVIRRVITAGTLSRSSTTRACSSCRCVTFQASTRRCNRRSPRWSGSRR